MPVTIKPAPHGANAYKIQEWSPQASSGEDLFRGTCSQEAKKLRRLNMIQSSFEKLSKEDVVFSNDNGFVNAAILAYNQHYKLIIRPEDVWFSILTQLNAYINANAEELRDIFVAHEGKKGLELHVSKDIQGTALLGVDWGKFSFQMSKLIAENIKDASLRDWILPTFTTTTKVDQAVASIIMMSTMQKYFTFSCFAVCGLPAVTLLGEKQDWQKIQRKLERLPTFGKEAAEWYTLLNPVLSRFVKSFDEPDSEATKDFWQSIAHYSNEFCGHEYWSGWITSFCFWDEDGRRLRNETFGERMKAMAAMGPAELSNRRGDLGPYKPCLELDGTYYHSIKVESVPKAVSSVPVEIIDDGDITHSVMVAGLVGMRISSSGELLHGKDETGLDTLQPESGWWIYDKDEKEVTGKEEDMYYSDS